MLKHSTPKAMVENFLAVYNSKFTQVVAVDSCLGKLEKLRQNYKQAAFSVDSKGKKLDLYDTEEHKFKKGFTCKVAAKLTNKPQGSVNRYEISREYISKQCFS